VSKDNTNLLKVFLYVETSSYRKCYNSLPYEDEDVEDLEKHFIVCNIYEYTSYVEKKNFEPHPDSLIFQAVP
jgi:hypothetical protein